MKHSIRELTKAFPDAKFSKTNGGHWRIELPNGRVTFTSSTTGDHRTLKNTISKIKRALQCPPRSTA
jgi:hypothetical protein